MTAPMNGGPESETGQAREREREKRGSVGEVRGGCTYLIGSPSSCGAASNSLTVVPIVPRDLLDLLVFSP